MAGSSWDYLLPEFFSGILCSKRAGGYGKALYISLVFSTHIVALCIVAPVELVRFLVQGSYTRFKGVGDISRPRSCDPRRHVDKDVEVSSGDAGLFNLVYASFWNEYQKWWGHSTRAWDSMYSIANYRHKMESGPQRPRYVKIVQVLQEMSDHQVGSARPLRVLDVGCGVANLLQMIEDTSEGLGAGRVNYVGIDISETAIGIAKCTFGTTSGHYFKAVAMQDFQPNTVSMQDSDMSHFDAVIFNESLYYVNKVDQAGEMAAKAWEMLVKDGKLIISMSDSVRSSQIWTHLKDNGAALAFENASFTAVESEVNAWMVGVFTK